MDLISEENKIKYPIAIEMVIPEKRLTDIKNKRGECIQSGHGVVASDNLLIKYSIAIYPNQDEIEKEEETWIYFLLDYPSEMDIEANFIIKIESANYIEEREYLFIGEDDYYYKEKICTTDELFDPQKRFIVDEKMVIKIDGYLIFENEEEYDEKWKQENISDSLCLALWEQENTKDFKIIVGKKEVTAHKSVLAARSPVFTKMFESGMKEAQENKVEITDFSFEVVESAIKILYHQSLVSTISLEIKMKLLQFFDKYDIQLLKDVFEKYLITVINEITVCRLVNASLLSNAKKLETKCAEFLQSCLKTKPIADFDLLDKDFALKLLQDAFCFVSNVKLL